MQLGRFSAWIEVEGKTLEEYEPVEGDSNLISCWIACCWIASDEGKAYSVNWRDHNFQGPTSGKTDIDGHSCGGKVIHSPTNTHQYKEGIYQTSTSINPFIFSTVKTADDDTLLNGPAAPDIGLIQLTIHNVELTGPPCQETGQEVPELVTFHEQSKKGFSHQTSFGEIVSVPEKAHTKSRKIGEPIAIFQFRYRPLEILQAQEIAPVHRSKRNLSEPDDEAEDTANRKKVKANDVDSEVKSEHDYIDSVKEEEGVDYEQQLADLQRQMEAVKAKQREAERRKAMNVKREPIVGVSIDLTDDD